MQKPNDNEYITMEEIQKIEAAMRERNRLNWDIIQAQLNPDPVLIYFNTVNAAYRKLLGASKARKLIMDNLIKADLEVGQAIAELLEALERKPDSLKGENNESESSV